MKRIALAFFVVFSISNCFGQSGTNPVVYPQMSSPSPDAAAIGRYGEFPVSLATGTPNISIPLYEINTGKLKMPINISYHASGIRVNDVASRVGLGWSLEAGGNISRAVKGLPDDDEGVGYVDVGLPLETDAGDAFACYVSKLVLFGNQDGIPDDFFYSLPGKSGKFMFTNKRITGTAIPVTIPYDLMKIKFGYNSFTITDDDGTFYVFGTSLGGKIAYEMSHSFSSASGETYPGVSGFVSNWYLTEMISADKTDTIRLTYSNSHYVDGDVRVSTMLTDDVSDPATGAPHACTHSYGTQQDDIEQIRLNEIYFRNGKVSFEYAGPQREDLPGDSSLTGLRVYQNNNGTYTQVKRFSLYQSYFLCNNIAPQNTIFGNVTQRTSVAKRLRLDSLKEVDINGLTKPPYIFGYMPNHLPYLHSNAQDFWGFYNGATGNSNNMLIFESNTSGNVAPSSTYGANRNSNADSMAAAMLIKITFPTGGFTNFQFEANRYNNVAVGGLRIKKIVSNDGKGRGITKTFNYYDSLPISNVYNGNMTSEGSFFTIPCALVMPNGTHHNNVYQENFTAPLGSSSGAAVCYGQVEELFDSTGGANGKNVYTYTKSQDITSPTVPQFTNTNEWSRGELLTEKTYKTTSPGNFLLLKSKRNIYTYNDRPSLLIKSLTARASYLDQYSGGSILQIPGCSMCSANNIIFAEFNPVLIGNEYLTQTIDTLFDQNGLNPQIDTVNYFYDNSNNIAPTRTETVDSKGAKIKILKHTALEKTDINAAATLQTGASVAIDSMVSKNMISQPIEEVHFNNSSLVSIYRTNYKVWSANMVAPQNTQTAILHNALDTRLQYIGYDKRGNLRSVNKTNDLIKSYIWDYNGVYPIAEVTNADSMGIAFTSFESDGSGNWTIPSTSRDAVNFITGKNSYSLASGAIVKSGLISGRIYIISYWSKNGSYSIAGGTGTVRTGRSVSPWTYYEHTVTTTSTTLTISGAGNIDELRLYPQGSQMTSYTFSPLVGMTSMTDPNGEITYYEYDGFSRLKNIKDYQDNIIKNYQYNYANSCGPNCTVLPMQTFNATNTLSYPVGVFNVNGKLLGNATNQSQYISTWMADTSDAHTGTIAAGNDSMHFKFTVNTGRVVPPSLTGCRYYQYDLAYNQLDAVRNINGCYVDFGDGISMRLGKTLGDTAVTIAPNTTLNYTYSNYNVSYEVYWIHTYPDSSEKTITLYHNDGKEYIELDNYFLPAPSLNRIRNLRGNIPQNMQRLSTSCFQDGSVLTVSGISNWNSVSSVRLYQIYTGDRVSVGLHMNYAQNCLANDKDLEVILTGYGLYTEGYEDTTFKISRFKTDWNTYFTKLDTISICDDHWNRENLSALKQLRSFAIYAGNQKHSLNPANNPIVPLPVSVVDNVINQISAGAGQFVSNGTLIIGSGGTARSSLSDAAFNQLKSKGWTITINNVAY